MTRDDLMALTEEAAGVSGIEYVMSARYDEAMGQLLDSLPTYQSRYVCSGISPANLFSDCFSQKTGD